MQTPSHPPANSAAMTISTAVIIAAGMGTRLGDRSNLHPKGFIEIGGKPIVEKSLAYLASVGIRRTVIVTGHLSSFYEDLADRNPGFVETLHNSDYADTGSMFSLASARDAISGDFLLLESDLIYERRALTELLEHPQADIVLMSGLTHSGDEVWIETRGEQLLNMSKNRRQLGTVAGELVGICKITAPLYQLMCEDAESAFDEKPRYCYETDCLVSVASHYPIHCHRVDDLIWSEIDTSTHLRRVHELVYPRICELDESLV